jgi:SAM-dependent methyltransferase
MKLSTRTDATSGKWVVQWVGSKYPQEGAVGLHFPFRPPRKSTPTGFQQSQSDLADSAPEDPSLTWRYTDNGFSSFAAMEELHRPIVALAREALAGESGNVLDLGCGNGMLLSLVCEERDTLVPHGIDSNSLSLDHARQLLPRFANNFVHGDLFSVELWPGGTERYALAIFMLGRLLEAPRESSMRMLDHLQESCSRVLVYAYPDHGKLPLEDIARQFGVQVAGSSHPSVAFLK